MALQSLVVMAELLHSVVGVWAMSWSTCWFQSFCTGAIVVDYVAFKPNRVTPSHFANPVLLHLTLHTVLAPAFDQVKLGFGYWFLMCWEVWISSGWICLN